MDCDLTSTAKVTLLFLIYSIHHYLHHDDGHHDATGLKAFVELHYADHEHHEEDHEVSRLHGLPSFEAGYRYQGILGQRFNGVHVGVTLPLWEQKYRTETRQAQVLLADLEIARYANEYNSEIRELNDRQAMLNQSLEEYRLAIQSVDNGRLLDKALQLGEITTLEYFLETSLYQNARLHYLRLEYENQVAVARLTKGQL